MTSLSLALRGHDNTLHISLPRGDVRFACQQDDEHHDMRDQQRRDYDRGDEIGGSERPVLCVAQTLRQRIQQVECSLDAKDPNQRDRRPPLVAQGQDG